MNEASSDAMMKMTAFATRALDRRRIVLDITHKPDFHGSATLRDRHRVLFLGDVESNKNFAILSHVRRA
jgi:hypothetical protein